MIFLIKINPYIKRDKAVYFLKPLLHAGNAYVGAFLRAPHMS